MNNKRKKIITAIILFTLVLSQSLAGYAQTETIHETSEKQTITQGVTQENIVRFTTKGWLNINTLRVDMANPYIRVDTLTNTESVEKLGSAKTLAARNNALAAVNASFFSYGENGQGAPLGPVMQSENFVFNSSSFNAYGNVMGSFSLSKLNEALYGYWKTSMNLVAPTGKTQTVAQYNKPSGSNYTDFTIIDGRWMKTSLGASAAMPDITEMLVTGGVVAGIYTAQPPIQIPDNSYVVVTRQAGSDFINQNFKAGDPVVLDVSTTPDWKNLKMSVTGGSLLVTDGVIPQQFSYNISYISQNQPRTAVGSSQDGKTLFLVTVDGRQGSSIGMTQKEIAEYMLGLGAYNALNLDGGGSTTMVARKPGTTELEVVNSPSDGIARGVSTGIGVFSSAPEAPLAGLIIDTDDVNIFLNATRSFTVRGYDKYNNPVTVAPEDVKWSVSGVKGSFTGNTLLTKSVGEGKVTAKVGDVSASRGISVLSGPAQLQLSRSTLKLPVGQSASFTVTGVNRNGYSAVIDPKDLKWTVKGNIGNAEEGKFTAAARGTGYVDVSAGSAHAYCAVSVSADVEVPKDTFEKAGGSFDSYPKAVEGSYGLSNQYYHSGKASGKLTYNFSSQIEGNRAAYYVLSNGGMNLDPTASEISLWVYNDHENSNWLRAEVLDSKGEKQTVDFVKTLDWNGWQKVTASLENIDIPAKLTRIYLVQVNPVDESGTVYFDDLSMTISGYPTIDSSKIPKNTEPVDDALKETAFKKSATSFRFAAYGQLAEPKNALEKLLMKKLAVKTDKLLDAAVITGGSSHKSFTGNITSEKPVIAGNSFNVTDVATSRFIQLDTSGGGLRASDSSQWKEFLDALASFKGSNVFITMANPPSTFKDHLEAKLFRETLSEYRAKNKKNVWVFYNGSTNDSTMIKGVRYISSMGYRVDGLKPNQTAKVPYILVTVKGSTVTYCYKPIM